MKTIRVVLFMDAHMWAANSGNWLATSHPCAKGEGYRRYQIVVEIPDPREADEVVRGAVREVES